MGKATFYCGGCGSAFRNEESDPNPLCATCRPARAPKPAPASSRRQRAVPGTTRREASPPRRSPMIYLALGGLALLLAFAIAFALSRRPTPAQARAIETPPPAAR